AVAASDVETSAALAATVDEFLRGVPGVLCLIGRQGLIAGITGRLDQLDAIAAAAEQRLDAGSLTDAEVEAANASPGRLRDAIWGIGKDGIGGARVVDELGGKDAGTAAIAGYLAIQQSFSALDRLEVRGRDSAGVHLFVWNHGLSLADPTVHSLMGSRGDS